MINQNAEYIIRTIVMALAECVIKILMIPIELLSALTPIFILMLLGLRMLIRIIARVTIEIIRYFLARARKRSDYISVAYKWSY